MPGSHRRAKLKVEDKARFKELLEGVMSYYRQDTSAFILNLWWQACQGFDFEQVQKAMTKHATDPDVGQFAPKVADIVRQLSGTKTDRAVLAWGKVFEAMQRVGQYQDVVFDDPAIHAAVMDLGGWPKICQTLESDISYLQHRFCELHRAYVGRGQFEFPRMLGGSRSADHEYTQRGLPVPDFVVIGNAETAKKVYLGGQKNSKLSIGFSDQLRAVTEGMA
jgi:hypothetical protein